MQSLKFDISRFYTDPAFPLVVQLNIVDPAQCDVYGSATATPKCGPAPYAYVWEASDDGTHWYAYGTTQTISTIVPTPANNGTYGTRLFRVKVTDANNNVTYATASSAYRCVHGHGHLLGGNNRGIAQSSTTQTPIQKNTFSIYPNPNHGSMSLELQCDQTDEVEVSAYDLAGRMVERLYKGTIDKGSRRSNYHSNPNLLLAITISS